MGILGFFKSFISNEKEQDIVSPIDISCYHSLTTESKCPTCNEQLELFPTRSRKCPKCKSKIIRVKIPETDVYALLNENEGLILKDIIGDYYNNKHQAAIEADPYYSKNNEDYNQKLEEALSCGDLQEAKMISFNYSNKLLSENDDDPSAHPDIYSLRFNSYIYEIVDAQSLIPSFKVQISAGLKNCKKQNLDGVMYTPEQFEKEKPIPCKNCTAIPVYSCGICIIPE